MPPKMVPNLNPFAREQEKPDSQVPTALTFEPEMVDVQNKAQVTERSYLPVTSASEVLGIDPALSGPQKNASAYKLYKAMHTLGLTSRDIQPYLDTINRPATEHNKQITDKIKTGLRTALTKTKITKDIFDRADLSPEERQKIADTVGELSLPNAILLQRGFKKSHPYTQKELADAANEAGQAEHISEVQGRPPVQLNNHGQVVSTLQKMTGQSQVQAADNSYRHLADLMKLYPSQDPTHSLRLAKDLQPMAVENQASKEVEDMAISEQLGWLQTLFDARQGAKPGIGTLKKLEVRPPATPSPSALGTSTPAPLTPRTTDYPDSSSTFTPGGNVGLNKSRRGGY